MKNRNMNKKSVRDGPIFYVNQSIQNQDFDNQYKKHSHDVRTKWKIGGES